MECTYKIIIIKKKETNVQLVGYSSSQHLSVHLQTLFFFLPPPKKKNLIICGLTTWGLFNPQVLKGRPIIGTRHGRSADRPLNTLTDPQTIISSMDLNWCSGLEAWREDHSFSHAPPPCRFNLNLTSPQIRA